MNGFLTRLLDRQLNSSNTVSPQARGRFEPAPSSSMLKAEYLPFEKKNNNIESGEEHLFGNKDLIASPANSFLHDTHLGKADKRNIPSSFEKPENKPSLTENEDTRIEALRIDEKKIVERHNNPEQLGDNKKETRLNTPKLVIELLNKEGKTEIFHQPEYKVEGDTSYGQKKTRIDIPKLFVPPANSKTGISQSINSAEQSENISNPKDGVLKTPKWLGDWNTGGNQVTDTEVAHEQSPPTIKVNIGRIEVRAIMQPVHTFPQQTETPKPKSSLEDYLNKSNKDQR